jgi:hypothetical protein
MSERVVRPFKKAKDAIKVSRHLVTVTAKLAGEEGFLAVLNRELIDADGAPWTLLSDGERLTLGEA